MRREKGLRSVYLEAFFEAIGSSPAACSLTVQGMQRVAAYLGRSLDLSIRVSVDGTKGGSSAQETHLEEDLSSIAVLHLEVQVLVSGGRGEIGLGIGLAHGAQVSPVDGGW